MANETSHYDVPAFFKKRHPEKLSTEEKVAPNKLGKRLDSNAKGAQKISAFRLRKSGNSTIVTVPEKVLALLELEVGDYLEFVYLEDEKLLVVQPSEDGNKKKKSRPF